MTTGTLLQPSDLLQIFAEVLASLIDETAPDALLTTPTSELGPGPTVNASVSVSGAWHGHVIVACRPDLARQIAASLLMMPAEDVADEDVADAMGEVANVVGGNIKSMVPSPSTLSLPHVTTGIIVAQHWPSAHELCRRDMSWNGQPLAVSVWTSADAEVPSP